jgi:hypothetical protein
MGGTQFISVGKMDIHGNYGFDERSILSINVLPESIAPGKYGKIDYINGQYTLDLTNVNPIIEVDGRFIMNFSDMYFSSHSPDGRDLPVGQNTLELAGGNVGVTIFDAITNLEEKTAIWLLYAGQGIESNNFSPRNLYVYYCNSDGTKCFDYLTAAGNAELAVYLREDDTNNDGLNDSLFAVFDDAFGGPILIYKIQPEVRHLMPDFNTDSSAGAIDNWIYYGFRKSGFNPNNNNPIETVKAAFAGTIFQDMAGALYDRMADARVKDPRALYNFSRLFTPAEAKQLALSVNAAERSVQQIMQKRMIDESLWTRNRVRSKGWLDMDYGYLSVKSPDGGDPAKGNKLSLMGGYDVQISRNTIVGFNAGMTTVENSGKQAIDLSFATSNVSGRREGSISDTALSVGGYFITKLADYAQFYASANLHSHTMSLEHDQSYMGNAKGSGKTSSITGEIGLIHSLSAQYIVGNLSARFARNNGFEITEKVDGVDYMDIMQKQYTTVAPGYSVMLQKRIYLQPTFIMRPYLSAGAEYEVVSMGDAIQYKFAPSDLYSDLRVGAEPLWLTGKVGVEFLTIGGMQFGGGYEYHHNAAIQMHSAHLNASLRF